MHIYFVELLQIVVVVIFIDKQVMMTLLEYFQFIFLQHDYIDATCYLEGLVVVVEVIVDLDAEHQTAEEDAVDIEAVEGEAFVLNVAVHDDDGEDETFR